MSNIPQIIFLCGFSGSGKTETARHLADLIAYDCTDTDEVVEETLGKSIPEIFAQLGEAKFRFTESDIIRMAVKRSPQVISLGGGTIADEHNLKFIRDKGFLIYLKVSPEAIYERLKDSHVRPMLQSFGKDEKEQEQMILKRIKTLLAEREQYYLKADLTINTDGKSPDQVAGEIKDSISQDGPAS